MMIINDRNNDHNDDNITNANDNDHNLYNRNQ